MMRVKYLGLGVVFLWFVMGAMGFAQNEGSQDNLKEALKRKIDQIKGDFDVDVYYDQDFLVDGRGNKISSSPIPPSKALKAMDVVITFLKAYPLDFVHQNIGEIYLCEGLKFNQQSIGGLSANVGNVIKRSIILDLATSESGSAQVSDDNEIDEEYSLRTLHHELSHNMMYQYESEFPAKEWMAVNGKKFKYYGSGRQFIADVGEAACALSNDTLREEGFVKGYSQSALGEDVATIAEAYYVTPKKLARWMNAYPKIGQKVQLFDQFYHAIGAR